MKRRGFLAGMLAAPAVVAAAPTVSAGVFNRAGEPAAVGEEVERVAGWRVAGWTSHRLPPDWGIPRSLTADELATMRAKFFADHGNATYVKSGDDWYVNEVEF